MNSYQKRVKERDDARQEVEKLKEELYSKANIFWKTVRCLGVNQISYGTVIEGKKVILRRVLKCK